MDLLGNLVSHTNRFAREQVHYVIRELVHSAPGVQDVRFAQYISLGMDDNWSQVRYAAGEAARVLIRKSIATHSTMILDNLIIPHLLMNRHFVAEGVMRQAQDTWRIMVGAGGGLQLIGRCMNGIMSHILKAGESMNHSVREAAIGCMYELLCRVLLETKYLEHVERHKSSILRVLVVALEDDAWPVRQLEQQAIGRLYEVGFLILSSETRAILLSKAEFLVDLLLKDICHPIIPIRSSASECLAHVAPLIWASSKHCSIRITRCIADNVSACLDVQESISRFSSFRRVTSDEWHENRPMYSCGSLISNSAIRRLQHCYPHSTSDDCCGSSHIRDEMLPQPWERTDGALRLYLKLLSSQFTFPALIQTVHEHGLSRLISILQQREFPKSIEIHGLIRQNMDMILSTISFEISEGVGDGSTLFGLRERLQRCSLISSADDTDSLIGPLVTS